MKAMKTIYNKVAGFAVLASLAGGMASCMSEAPFSDEGEGIVRMNVSVNTTLTRAEAKTPSNNQDLLEKCVIYISGQGGLLHKWTGVQNLPSELAMRYGHYVAEAWAGDSVSASFESEGRKFYRCYHPFEVNSATTQVSLRCGLANVVASVDESTIDNEQIKDVTVTFSNSKGELAFDSNNWSDKAYFMMPSTCKNIDYVVKGKDLKDKEFTKVGVIENVQSAHEYRLKFEYHPAEPTDGGAFIQIVIDDSEIVTAGGDVTMLGIPAFAWDNADMKVGDQIVGDKGSFVDQTLRIAAYNGFENISVKPVDNAMFDNYLPVNEGLSSGSHSFDVINMTDEYKNQLSSFGIQIETFDDETNKSDLEGVPLHKYIIRFTASWLNSLEESDEPYELTVKSTDTQGRSNETVVSIANTKKAITNSAPINVDAAALINDLTAVGARSVSLPLTFEEDADLTNAAVQYREVGATEWNIAQINITKAISASVTISGLKPGAEYEYRTVAGEIIDGEYELKSKVATFKTETTFTLPNASMEQWSNWSDNSKVVLPAAGGIRSFWDTGNHGSSTMSVTLTQSSDEVKHTGTLSAKLSSQLVGLGGIIGKFAAGNLFVGEYKETKGTNGVINFGRPYDGSHPTALRLWANYRPGTVLKGDGKNTVTGQTVLTNGQPDHGQIYIAFTTGIVTVDTSNTKTLFDADADYVVGYGQVTWNGNFGPDGSLAEVNIPIEWKDKAKTVKPTHMIIVCSASKYGDFFTGCEGSTMYLDDFELVYE